MNSSDSTMRVADAVQDQPRAMATLAGMATLCSVLRGRAVSRIVGLAAAALSLALAAAPVHAQYATGGSGMYRNNILWFSWGANGANIPQEGMTKTNTYSVAGQSLAVTCSLSNISNPGGTPPDLKVYRSGNFFGDALDDLYNIGGTGTANSLVIGVANRVDNRLVTFDFACSATLGGQPFALGGLVLADAETNYNNEYIGVTIPSSSTLRIIERLRTGCTARYQVTANAAGTTYTTSSPDTYCTTGNGPMMVGFIDGTTSGQVQIKGGGITAVALGVMMGGTDYGDAPASYGEATHLLQSTWSGGTIANGSTQDIFAAGYALGSIQPPAVRLGNLVDAEIANQPSPNADADDLTGINDEDGLVPGSVLLTPGATTAQAAVLAVNASASPVVLAGWIDFNRNGTFEAGERTEITVPAHTNSPTPFTLTWSGLAPIANGASTIARFRIATDAADVASPTGIARDGEVEDHLVPIATLTPTLEKTFAPDTIPYGGVTTMTFIIDNSAAGAIERTVGFTDNLAAGLQIANPANAITTCGGAVSAVPGDNKVTLSGGTIAAGAFCSVSVNITNRPGFSGLCYNPNFANENQNLVGLQNLVAQIQQYTCVSVTPPDCLDSATTNGFGNISGLSPNLNNGVSGQCIAVMPSIELIKVSEGGTGSFGFTLGNTSATNPVTIVTTAPGAPGTSGGVFEVVDMSQPVTIAESGLPAGWTLSGMTCQLADGSPIGSFDAPGATWTASPGSLDYGQQITCTATNLSPPAVTITKTLTGESGSQPGIAEPGETLTYTITLTNSGGSDATAYGVTDRLDPNTSFASATNGGTHAAGIVTWSGLTVPAGGSLTLTVVVTVADPIPAGVTQIGNVAYETGTTPPACPPAGGQCVVVPTAPKVAIAKTLSNESGSLPGFAEPGEQLTYTITLTNSGGSAAANYGVTDTLDPNVAFVSADNGGALSGSAVTWSGLTVPAGGSLSLTVVVKVVDPIPAGVTQIGNVAYETGTTPPACPPAGGQCVIVPTIHPPLACSDQDIRATQRWWFFGNRGGIDFGVSGSAANAVLNPSNINTAEGSTVVTDTAGQLQFWSNAKVAYTRNHTPMPNGSGLLGNDSATQTVAAFPAVGHPGRYFIVTTDTDVSPAPNGQLRYSVVDMTLNGGLGDIVAGQKNIPLGAANTASEALTAVPNADGTGFWVLTATNNAPTLLAYAFDDNGPVGTAVASTLSTSNGRWYGSLYFNKKLNQLVQATADNPGSGQLRVLYFDGATGQAIERFTWRPNTTGVPAGSYLYTADFSPAGDYVYATRIFSGGRLYRYRITGANTSADVAASQEYLGSTGSNQGGHVRRGADGRMYIPGNLNGTALNLVNTPDGASAGYVAAGFPLAAGASTTFGLPQTVTGCPLPTAADISITKTASAPAPTGTPNQYAITYVVTATNAGGSAGTYDLADTLTFHGATVTAISAPMHASSTGDTQDGTLGTFSAPSGGTIVTGEHLAATGIETWTYTVTYTITDAATAADCANPTGGLRNHAALGGAAADAPPADTCSGAPRVGIVKTASAPVPTGTPDQYTLTYTVDVSNSGTLPGVYDLADTLTFNGATVNAIGVPTYSSTTGDTQDGTLGTFTAPTGGTIVTGETIKAGGAETWTYTVTYTVIDATAAQDCANPSGGLRNHAQLGGSLSGESTTCTGAPAVNIGKSAGSPVPTGNPNEYALDYLVSVQNDGTLSGTYDLTDTFTFNGVSVVSVSAITHAGSDPLGTTLGTLTATGGTIVTGETIAAGANESYAYRVVFTLDDVAVVGACAAGGGLKNLAALGGSSSGQVGTCSDVPNIAVAKAAGAPTPTATLHQYTITYTVTVSNAGAAAGVYDLADSFAFAGATVDAVSAITHGGSDPLATTLGTLTAAGGTIVSGESIGAESDETYTYTVTFTLTDPALAGDCTNPAGGLRNTAALGGSASGEAPTCTGAPNVAIAKALTGESGTQAGQAEPGEQLTYTITLTNSGGSDATNYGVTDTLDPNVTFVSATNGGTAAGGVVTWSGLTVPANGSLALTVVVTVNDPIPAGVTQVGNVAYETGTTPPACPPAGPQCVIVPTAAQVTIAKALTGESGSQAGIAEPGETLTYTITLSNSGGSDATNYGVTDRLDPNTTFVSATNGGTHAGGLVTWTGLTVPANSSVTLTVVVTVNDPIPAGVTQVGNVAYETGTTPPACPPAGAQCVIVPTAPKVTIAKTLSNESGSLPGIAEPGETLTYTITLSNSGGSDATAYGVTDRLDPNTSFVSATNGGAHAAGLVTWAGLTVPANGAITLTVVVTVNDPIPPGVTQVGNVAYQTGTTPPACPPAGPQCVVVPTAAAVALTKSASAPAPTGVANQYRITYTVTATNRGGSVGTYDLADTLTFNGATVTAISAPVYASTTGDIQDGALGSFTAPGGGTIVTAERISALGVETWTYTVTYTLTDAAVAADCASANGGLRNAALLGGSAAGPAAAETCSGAARVNLIKSAAAPVPTGNPNEFTLTYTVDVMNAGTLVGVYDLADTLGFNGATVTAISAPTYSSSTGDTQDGTLGTFIAPNGGTIVSGETIAAGGAERWMYTVTYTVTNAGTAQDCASPAGGLRNSAALGGSFDGQSTTCTGAPAVAIGKSVSGPTATGNPKEYTLDYLVTVQNNGTLGGVYDLADTFVFNGVTVVSVSAVTHGGSDPLDTTLGTLAASGGTIVTGESIAAGANETYAYRVTFTLDDALAVGTCAAGGGLKNQAALGGSSSGQVGTCSDVPDIAIGKTASAPVPTGLPYQYTITYTVSVENAGAAGGSYDLADTFAFAGASVDAVGAITHAGPDPLATTLGTLSTVGGTIVTGETIAAGSSESYTYTVTFTLTDPALAGDCANPAGGLRNTAVLGGSATGDAQTCTGSPDVAIVKALTGEDGNLPGEAEPGEQLTYTITLTNTGGSDATQQSVTDVLDPNVTFVSATNGGAHVGGHVEWTGLTVPAQGSLMLTVVVQVVDPIPAGVMRIGNVAYDPLFDPPNCTAVPMPANCTSTPTPAVVAIAKVLTGESGSQAGIAEPGETLTYTITLSNSGGGDALNYGVTDRLDPNTSFVSATNGGTHAAGFVSWSGLTVPAGGSLTLTVVVKVVDPIPPGVTQVGNVAYQTGTTPPACPPAGAQCVIVPTAAQVAIAKALTGESGSQPGIAEPGETLTYTITLSNNGGTDATNYGVTDRLDPNTTFVSTTNGGTHAAGVVTWAGLTVPANGSITLTVVVKVVDPIPAGVTQVGNVAYETGTTPPACPPAGPQCVIVPTAAQVTIAKALTSESGSQAGIAEPGETLTYTITLSNNGGSDATNYGVTDRLDPNTTFVSATNGGAHAAGLVTWSGLTVPANSSVTLTVVVTVNDPIPAGVTQIGNVAYETGTTPPACPPAGPQCVIVPTAAQVTIAKALTGESGSQAGIAEPGETLTYTITLSNSGGTDATNYGVTDRLDPNTTFVSATNGGAHAAGLVTWSGLTVPANGAITLTVVVKVVDPIPAGVTQIGNVAYETGTTPPACPPAGPQCVIVPTAAAVALTKSASAPAPTGVANQYRITYTVTATNRGGSVGSYDLSDTLTFNGATVTAISAPVYASTTGDIQDGALGSFTAPTGGTIVSGERIGALGSETWTYTVTYTLTDAAVAADCASANGGLRNHAALGGGSAGAPAADTCTGAPSVSIVKTASAPQPTGAPNTFTLTYVIDVTNTGTLIGSYDLSDTLSFNGATVTAVGAPVHSSSTGDTQDGTLGTFTAPNGGTIVSGETIAAGGTERWTYAVTYTVTNAGTAQDCANPAGGLRNRALLGGAMSGESATCTGAPAVVIGKSASGPVPTGNPHEYRLSYLVSVQNDGTLPGVYDLADTFTFSGVTVVSVSAVTHGGSDPLDTTLGTLTASGGQIVSGEGIAAGANETYGYSVTFTIDDVATVGTCAGSGGLRNQAALGGSASGQVGTCSDVPDIAVTKTASGPVPTGVPNQYTLTYTVTVTNAGAASGSYDLADTFAFAGASVDAVGAITHAGPDPLSSTLGTLSAAGGTIVTGETIAAGSSERYTYTVTFTLTDPALADDCANPAGGLRNTAALGGSATGDARTCTGTPQLAISKVLSGESGSLPGVAEPGETLTYTITLDNAGSSAAVDQRIVDRLDPHVTFVSASHGGTQVGGNVEWTGLSVPAHGTLTLTVVVQVVDPIPAGVLSIGNVAYDPTIGQPDCTATPRPANCTSTPTPAVVTIAKALTGESGSWPGVAEPGETLTYTITLSNSGGTDATAYGVTDRLDPNTTFVSASNGGAHAAGVVTWSGLSVPAGGSVTLTVVVTVVDPIPSGVTQIGNVAYETGTTPPACPPAGPQCVIVPTAGAVVITKALTGENGNLPGLAEPGEQLTYTITLTNTGGTDATAYGVTDRLDPNTTFVSASNGGAHAAGVVTWAGLTVPANGSITLTVVVQVVDPIPTGVTQIGNVAYETGTTPPACPPAGPQCVIVPTEGAVTIAKALTGESGSLPGVAEPGETLTYTITLTNTGGSDVLNYAVSDRLDPNTTFVSATHGGTHAAGLVGWSGLTVPANSTITLTVVVTVVDPIPAGVTQIGNVVYETGTPPPACPPAGAQCVIVPTAGAVAIVKSVVDANGNGLAEPGETLTYTIVLSNAGGTAVTGYAVTDPLDPNTAFVSADNGGVQAGGVVSWNGLTVPANGSLSLTVVVTVNDPLPRGVTQIGNLAYETGMTPPDCSATPRPANCAVIPVPDPAGMPQLQLAKTANTTTLRPGGTVIYTITVANVGTADATNVTISDPLPAGVAAYAWTCAAAGGVACPNVSGSGAIAETVPTFPVGGTLVYTVTATLATNPPATVVNTASVTPPDDATCAPDGSPPPCVATVIGTVVPPEPAEVRPVPAANLWALLLLGIGVLGLAGWGRRRAG